ncbi:MAG: helix-turn-helix transcriptional regulator, partial [Treponema sp.]|nr:helix-turn-helix transcriptional regulator [Treponema sp.]
MKKISSFIGFSPLPLPGFIYYYRTVDYSINDRLKQVRLALQLSQRAFPKGIFLKSGGYYGDIETHRNEVNERVVELVCSVYGVNKAW